MHEPNFVDTLIMQFDTALKTILPPSTRLSERTSPAKGLADAQLSAKEKKHVAGLMRINHSGEVCAQALYQGQALTARLPKVRKQMAEAAQEEIDHLAWCEARLKELDAHPSKLNLFWYFNAFILGALAGKAGDKYSLGFVAETEKQVSAHLEKHLKKLPENDLKSEAVLKQMYEDETLHAEHAIEAGAVELPSAVKFMMDKISKLMTKTSYYI